MPHPARAIAGLAQLDPVAKTLGKLAPTLIPLQNTRIVVNGYTDNVPVGPELERMGVSSNLQLSSMRADPVAGDADSERPI